MLREEGGGGELIAATIPATEHSVMCAGGKEDELMNTRKPYYNILLDDRAGLECAFNQLSNVISLIKSGKRCKY